MRITECTQLDGAAAIFLGDHSTQKTVYSWVHCLVRKQIFSQVEANIICFYMQVYARDNLMLEAKNHLVVDYLTCIKALPERTS